MHFSSQIEDLCQSKIRTYHSVSGGDINECYKITTDKGNFFLKTNFQKAIITAECEALDYAHKRIKGVFPHLVGFVEDEDRAGLLLEYIDEGSLDNPMQKLAVKLSQLHSVCADSYGFIKNNFIGTLPQSNIVQSPLTNWPEYYWEYRLKPQFEMAMEKGYYRLNLATLENLVKDFTYKLHDNDPLFSTPCLIHGDLWSGNYLIGSEDVYLIDPAMSYSHPWMDIGMTGLFGGFNHKFYETYTSLMNYKNVSMLVERASYYQLYYLLAHLNMFGTTYKNSCDQILLKMGY